MAAGKVSAKQIYGQNWKINMTGKNKQQNCPEGGRAALLKTQHKSHTKRENIYYQIPTIAPTNAMATVTSIIVVVLIFLICIQRSMHI